MECRDSGGVTTEERFLCFLEEFQRASRCPVYFVYSFVFRKLSASELPFDGFIGWQELCQKAGNMVSKQRPK